MKSSLKLKILIFLLLSVLLTDTVLIAQPSKSVSNLGNLYTTWVRLALLGKNQAEIEFFFIGIQEKYILEIKNRKVFDGLQNIVR